MTVQFSDLVRVSEGVTLSWWMDLFNYLES